MTSTTRPTQPGMVKSALRVLDLFELFESEQRPMRVGEIAEHLDAPLSSVSMLLKTLRARGYVDFIPGTRQYQPSARLSFLGEWAVGSTSTRTAIQNGMRKLAEETRDTILLGRQNGLLMQYLAIIEAPREIRLAPTTGTRRPMHLSALGMVLLAEQSDDAIGRLIRRYNAEHGAEMGMADEQAVKREIREIRRTGHYCSMGNTTPDAGVIAQIVPSSISRQPMAIAIGGPLERVRDVVDHWIDLLNTTVRLM